MKRTKTGATLTFEEIDTLGEVLAIVYEMIDLGDMEKAQEGIMCALRCLAVMRGYENE